MPLRCRTATKAIPAQQHANRRKLAIPRPTGIRLGPACATPMKPPGAITDVLWELLREPVAVTTTVDTELPDCDEVLELLCVLTAELLADSPQDTNAVATLVGVPLPLLLTVGTEDNDDAVSVLLGVLVPVLLTLGNGDRVPAPLAPDVVGVLLPEMADVGVREPDG